MLPSNMDLKEQLAEARRLQIVQGAARVFMEKGFHKATTKEIARAAGVSEGTIYNYFETKRDLLVAMIDTLVIQSIRDILTASPPEDPRQFIRVVLKDRFNIARHLGPQLVPIIAEMLTDAELRETVYQRIAIPITEFVEKFVQTRIEEGHFKPVNPVVVTRAFVGAAFLNFALKLSGVDGRYAGISEDELIEQITSLFLDGLLGHPAEAKENSR